MLQRKWLILSIACLLNTVSCAHGPKVSVCVSDPGASQFDCSNKKGTLPPIPYSASGAFSVYPPQSAQGLLDYCAAHRQPGQAAPRFTRCSTDLARQGLNCVEETCSINGFNNGAICKQGTAWTFVPFSASENYIGFSAADDKTLIDYCNIQLL